ncbi:hypothetical protein ACNQTB_03535 [Corynebacterium diphtheriae]
MSVETLQNQVESLTTDEWTEFFAWCGTVEYPRRKAQPLVDEAQAEVVKALQDEGKLTKPDALTDPDKLPEDITDVPEWANPGVDHASMYRRGDIVRVGEKIYLSQFDGLNRWAPGGEGVLPTIWLDITPLPKITDDQGHEVEAGEDDAWEDPNAVEDFKQPTGGHDAYPLGKKVKFEGHIYESVIESNAFSPTAYPAGWKKIR